jgi:PleD family two-component response regulator
VFVTEKKLSVQVRKVDGIEVYNMYFAKACEDEVLEQLASNSASTNHEHTSLRDPS